MYKQVFREEIDVGDVKIPVTNVIKNNVVYTYLGDDRTNPVLKTSYNEHSKSLYDKDALLIALMYRWEFIRTHKKNVLALYYNGRLQLPIQGACVRYRFEKNKCVSHNGKLVPCVIREITSMQLHMVVIKYIGEGLTVVRLNCTDIPEHTKYVNQTSDGGYKDRKNNV